MSFQSLTYRFKPARVAATAHQLARFLVHTVPPIVGWTVAAVSLGILVGFSAVILPPAGVFIIPSIVGLVLLWAMPDLQAVPRKAVRKLFFVVLVADLCVPGYYAIAGVGLPWISVRRLVTFLLVAVFALVVSGSSADRARIRERLAAAKSISICAIGFLVMIGLSIVTADAPVAGISPSVDAFLTWYVPFFVVIFVIKDQQDFEKVFRIICMCAYS